MLSWKTSMYCELVDEAVKFSCVWTLNPRVDKSFTNLLSSKEVACWETLDAAILASANVPLPIFGAAKLGILALSKVPLAIELAFNLLIGLS